MEPNRHRCFDQQTRTLKQYADAADAFAAEHLDHKAYYHGWESPTNWYLAEPGGITIQLDAPCGGYGSSNCDGFPSFDPSLFGQGFCNVTNTTSTCETVLQSTCPGLGKQKTNCTACVYSIASSAPLLAAGCDNSDMVTYCF